MTVSFNNLDLHDINSNLCNFLKEKIAQNDISTYVLSLTT
ncbi:hypothetical protein REIS_1376 [Rickettsia endosymbiont of Ixodes scapularis]|nr:hypothetical protein REIS_1376 [Rickettsia endosymbiont of Ixodes scapularis]